MLHEYTKEDLARIQQIQLELLKDFIRICNELKLDWFVQGGTAIGAVRHQGFIPWDDDIDVSMLRDDYDAFIKYVNEYIDQKNEVMGVPFHQDTSGQCIRFCRKGTKHVTEPHLRWKRHYGIHIDIIPYDNTSDDPILQKKHIKRSQFLNRVYLLRNVKSPVYGFNGFLKFVAAVVSCGIHVVLLPVPVSYILRKYYENAVRYNHKSHTLISLCDFNPQNWIIYEDEIYPFQKGKFEGIEVNLLNKNHEILTRTYGAYMELPPIEERVNHGAAILDFGDE